MLRSKVHVEIVHPWSSSDADKEERERDSFTCSGLNVEKIQDRIMKTKEKT